MHQLTPTAKEAPDFDGLQATSLLVTTLGLAAALTAVVILEIFVVQRFGGPFVPAASSLISLASPFRDSAPEPVAVVMMSDRAEPDEPRLGELWPFDVSVYRDWVLTAWCLGARAVYLDLSFGSGTWAKSPRQASLKLFVDLVETLNLAAEDSPEFARLRQANCPAELGAPRMLNRMKVLLAKPTEPRIAALFEARRSKGGTLAQDAFVSPVIVDQAVSRTNPPDQYPPASMALAAAACAQAPDVFPDGCRRLGTSAFSWEIDDRLEGYDMESRAKAVALAKLEPAQGLARVLPRCEPTLSATAGRWFRVPLKDWPQCPPVVTWNWFEFLASAPHLRELRPHIDGKLLLLSADSMEIPRDRVDTSMHAALPGVYVHAMAASQMLTSTSAQRPPEPFRHAFAIFVSIFMPIYVLGYLRLKRGAGFAAGPMPRGWRLLSRGGRWTGAGLILWGIYLVEGWNIRHLLLDLLLIGVCSGVFWLAWLLGRSGAFLERQNRNLNIIFGDHRNEDQPTTR